MPPDDIPIDPAADDSTNLPGTKPPIRKGGGARIGPEAEVRGGSAQPDEPPLEQQQRRDRANP
jgi:hypothetical protein